MGFSATASWRYEGSGKRQAATVGSKTTETQAGTYMPHWDPARCVTTEESIMRLYVHACVNMLL